MSGNGKRRTKTLVLSLRMMVGLVLTLSAGAKILWPTPDQTKFLAATVPWDLSFHTLTWVSIIGTSVEGTIGTGLLISSRLTRVFAFAALALSVVWVLMSMNAPTDDCGCFGDTIELSNTAHRAVLAALLASSAALFWMHKDQNPSDHSPSIEDLVLTEGAAHELR